MPITDYLERNAREYGNDVALVEINPDVQETRRVTWREYELIESNPTCQYRREITCLYSLADIVSGIAACTYGKFSSTIDGTMTYIAPAMNTEYLICEGMEIRQGKKVSLYEANIYDDKGQLVDKARFSFYMMNRSVVE